MTLKTSQIASSVRLDEAYTLIKWIDQAEYGESDRVFLKLLEDSVVWRELVELELHEVDEQIERIATASALPN
jgi:hypothetical protein